MMNPDFPRVFVLPHAALPVAAVSLRIVLAPQIAAWLPRGPAIIKSCKTHCDDCYVANGI
eukprot:scaffold262134_cov15-Prasinocladus_malaysianus.AAC.1